uniref:Uncharacterized protein n=1 Tax=Chenopodium quinoa TaxID=63459 RepID=A0A803LB19_CHEQI
MDVGTAMSVAQTLFAALQCSQLKELCSTADYKSKLDQLRATVVRIEAVLKDAESKQVLSEQEKVYIEELKDAVYEADDLFDEFVTLAERKQLTKGIKVRVLSLFTKFGKAYNMTQEVKKIKNKLDAIAYDKRFSLSIDPNPIKDRRLETSSYVYEADIIGRELDLEKILGVLLGSNVQDNVSFLSIVGIGGLGKTALAQLVYNDARVTTAFSLKLWTCVADENQEVLDVRGILDKILLATGHKKDEGSTMDMLQNQLRKKLAENKYLLVLDDVWTESCEQWNALTQYLKGGKKGSWIVVTTRSRRTAEIIEDGLRHELNGLSKEDSVCLFKRVAFRSQPSNPPEDLIKIGEDIVEKCGNVPLAIRVMGSLLYGQEKNKWLSIQKLRLVEVKESQISIIPILKLSYYKLESPIKACFEYCAIFPKDYEMMKDTLIRLWMANGYIPFDGPMSPEDLAEEYFSILLRRCFFQDVRKDEDGNIMSCKVHDLMHDVAQEVVGKEICCIKNMNGDMHKKVRHFAVQGIPSNYVCSKTHIRSFLHFELLSESSKMEQPCADALAANWKYLRVLDLSWSYIRSVPGSIGELIHLRYLDLSNNRQLEVLPGSITKLYNLQTLDLHYCCYLKEFPKDLRKLVKLRVLDLHHCFDLVYMPRGISRLTCLHTLTWFIVGSSMNSLFDELEDLKALRNLTGKLSVHILFRKTSANTYKINGGREGGCLGNKEHLRRVELYFNWDKEAVGRKEYDEAMMEMLQPLNSNLREFYLNRYQGMRLPRWPKEDNLATFLPNLVQMEFYCCWNLQNLGQIRLPHLKILFLKYCPNLTGILKCPALESLQLIDFNDKLKIINIHSNIREVKIDNGPWLGSL